MQLIFRNFLRFVTIATVLASAACSRMSEVGFDTKMALGSVSMVDRCGDFMKRAFPDSDIEILGSHVASDSQATLITVQGVRSDVPANSTYARSVAVECHFEVGILTGFRWIAGPVRPATTGQAP